MDPMTNLFRCGAGCADITPAIGTPMGGYANRAQTCQGMLDPLFVRALLLCTVDASALIIVIPEKSGIQAEIEHEPLAMHGSSFVLRIRRIQPSGEE